MKEHKITGFITKRFLLTNKPKFHRMFSNQTFLYVDLNVRFITKITKTFLCPFSFFFCTLNPDNSFVSH